MYKCEVAQIPSPSLVPQRLRDRPRWNQLRGIGNSAIAKSTIAIPILGYMLIFNDRVVSYLQIHTDFCQSSGCGVSWRLYFFYFGCCFIALGSAVYAVFCPALIKKHKDASAFFAEEKDFLSHSSSLGHLLGRIEEVKGSPASDPGNVLKDLVARNEGVRSNNMNMLAGPMNEHYYYENRRRAAARIMTFIAYLLGLALLIAPTVYTAYQIAMIAFRPI